MRELKFRRHTDHDNEFVYLDLENSSEDDKFIFYFEKTPIEQYTGLKDKDGKEIYEGDIVDYNDDGDCIGYVVYNAPSYEIMEKIGYPCWLKGGPHQRVIGNIHDNPELLENLNKTY